MTTYKLDMKPHEAIMAICGVFALGLTVIATVAVTLTSCGVI